MIIKYIVLLIFLFVNLCNAQQDTITSLDNDGLPAINEEIRKLHQSIDSKISTLQTAITNLQNSMVVPDHYIKGFELAYNSATVVSILTGTLELNGRFYNTTSNNTVNVSSASDGWVYIYAYDDDNDSNLSFGYLANAPNKSDTAGNTDGTLRYYYDGSMYLRCLGAVYKDAGAIRKFYQNGNYIKYAIFIGVSISSATSSNLPAISSIGYFELYIHTVSVGAPNLGELGIKATGSTDSYIYIQNKLVGDGLKVYSICNVNINQLIDVYKPYSTGITATVQTVGYWINIRD